jgi:hypothetical protein
MTAKSEFNDPNEFDNAEEEEVIEKKRGINLLKTITAVGKELSFKSNLKQKGHVHFDIDFFPVLPELVIRSESSKPIDRRESVTSRSPKSPVSPEKKKPNLGEFSPPRKEIFIPENGVASIPEEISSPVKSDASPPIPILSPLDIVQANRIHLI